MGSRSERDLGSKTSGGIAGEVESLDIIIGRAMDELDLMAASMLTKAADDSNPSHSSGSSGALALATPSKTVSFAHFVVEAGTTPLILLPFTRKVVRSLQSPISSGRVPSRFASGSTLLGGGEGRAD